MAHRQLLQDNRVALIQTIDIVHTPLWDYLLQYRVVDETAASRIRADNAAPDRQVSALIDYVRQRPVDCYARFRQALFHTNQSSIVTKILEPNEFVKESSVQTDLGGEDVSRLEEDSKLLVEAQTTLSELRAENKTLKNQNDEKNKALSSNKELLQSKENILLKLQKTIKQQEQCLLESQKTTKRREEDLLKSREEISTLKQRIAINDQELVSLRSNMGALSVGSPPMALASPVRELNQQTGRAECVAGLADQGAIVTKALTKGPLPTIVRLSSDGSQTTPGFPAEAIITAIIPQDDQVLLLEGRGRISRRRLHDLSQTTHTWLVPDVWWLEDGAALSHDQLVIVDSRKGELSTFNLSDNPREEKQVKVKGLKGSTSVACGYIEGSLKIAVAECNKHSVLIYNAEWHLRATIGDFGSQDGRLNEPVCCIILPYPALSGNILIADSGNHRVSEFTRQGNFVRHWLTNKDGIQEPESMSFVFPHLWLVHGIYPIADVTRFKIFQ